METEQNTSTISGFAIPYEVLDCEHGQGLFAKVFVPAGQLVWEYRSGVNVREYNEYELEAHLETLDIKTAQKFLGLSHF